MKRVRLTRSAEMDLLEIAAHVAADNPTAATNLIRRFDHAFRMYAQQPEGAAVYLPRPRFRHFAVGSYVVFYEPMAAGILIARVLHGSRNLTGLLGI
ncbi:MAG: type II toxin-antitoxin system RelE/ParE family toxin [Pirellulales bacterium]